MKNIITAILLLLGFQGFSQLTLDTSFADDGFLNIQNMTSAKQIETDDSGRIVCWANQANQNVIVRFLPDGDIDTTFGTDGIAPVSYNGSTIYIVRILVLADGSTLFLGRINNSSPYTLVVGKLDSNGVIDTAFGTNGYFVFEPSSGNASPISLIEHNGKVLIAATIDDNSRFSLLIKINLDGSIDESFGDNGFKITPIDYIDGTSCDLKIDAVGNIYISGSSGMTKYYISKYDSNGILDPSFGTNGQSNASIGEGGEYFATSHSIQLIDNNIFVIGEFQGFSTQPHYDFYGTAIAKFDSTTGAVLGVDIRTNNFFRYDYGYSSFRLNNNNILLGGSYSIVNGPQGSKFLEIDSNFENIDNLSFDFYSMKILSFVQQGTKVLAAGMKDNKLFITRLNHPSLGVNDIEINTGFEIYPNPATSEFKITSNDIIKNIRVYDQLGREIKGMGAMEAYDISYLTTGIYFVSVETKSGKGVKKLIVK